MEAPWSESHIVEHATLLANSFFFWTKKDLIDGNFDTLENSFHLYHASFALLSHGTEEYPIFNYANKKAQDLWKLDWDAFTKMPSSFSAKTMEGIEQQKLLEQSEKNGFIPNYTGAAITSEGKKFRIGNTIVWNILDERGRYRGQAAMIDSWEFI